MRDVSTTDWAVFENLITLNDLRIPPEGAIGNTDGPLWAESRYLFVWHEFPLPLLLLFITM